MSARSDTELKNVLQQIFVECDASVSTLTPNTTMQVTDCVVPISRIIEYFQLQDQELDDLEELWKSLVIISINGCVNLDQFKGAMERWIAKMQQVQSAQDSNNIIQKKFRLVNNADSSMDVTNDTMEIEIRKEFRELYEENNVLRDEIERHERSCNNLKRQHSITEKQLKQCVQKCQQLEKENDDQRDQLNELIKKEKTMAAALQRYTKEHQNLLNQLEAAEIEVQAIPSLKEELEKITKEKMDCWRLIAKLQDECDEKESTSSQLKTTITALEGSSINMKESYEYVIRDLREKNRQLADENVELESLSVLNSACLPTERLSISPVPDIDGYCMHSTPYKSMTLAMQDSLYTELKASGFTAECRRHEVEDLEEMLNEYDTAIFTILDQLEKVIQFFVTIRGSTGDLPHFNSSDTDARVYNVNVLRHKASCLLNMVTEEIARRNTRRDSSTQQDSSTQLRVDLVNATDSFDQLGIRSFQDLLLTHTIQRVVESKNSAAAGSQPILSHYVNNEEDDSFLRVIKRTDIQNRFRTIEPIFKKLHNSIDSTLGTLLDRKDSLLSGNLRYQSNTLPSSLQSVQSSSLAAEDSRQRTNGYQNSETNTVDAQGNSLMQEDNGKKSASFDYEGQILINREISKVSSVLQMDSKVLTTSEEEKTDARNFQIPEVSNASNPASPRRKISVYCRSFDVVTVQDPREDYPRGSSNLQVRQSPNDSPVQIGRITAWDRNIKADGKYTFSNIYREKNDSDSTNSTPNKQFQDDGLLLDDEPPIEQSIPRKVHLAPTRLKFPQEPRNELDGITEAPNCVVTVNSTELDILNSFPSPINGHKNDVSVQLSSTLMDKCKSAVAESASCSKNVSQARSPPNRCLFPRNQADSAKIAGSEDPHSQAIVQKVNDESQLRIERSVDSQMSSREDSLSVPGGGGREPAGSGHRYSNTYKKVARLTRNEADKAVNVASSISLADLVCAKMMRIKNAVEDDEEACERNQLEMKQKIRESAFVRRCCSEGENLCRLECHCVSCKRKNLSLDSEDSHCKAFPSFTDVHLQESRIANFSDAEFKIREDPSELELQKKYTAFSLCLCTDRLTLAQRIALSLRQRDESERSLSCAVQKMQQDIQALAPLCTDSESLERVNQARKQLSTIEKCVLKVSSKAETLGAVQQERRISRAILLADKYLQLLQSRCEKLVANIAESKRILVENNIVVEENPGELNDELPRIRFRSSTPANNRIMMVRRRASVATMSRPLGTAPDVTKDTVKQRNSVSGRMTLRRPSFTSESPRWDNEKLDRTESLNSISERGNFEQAESRRTSKEENNNMLRLGHSNSQSTVNSSINDNETWTNVKEEGSSEESDSESINSENSYSSLRSSHSLSIRERRVLSSWHIILLVILILCLIFYVIQAMSLNACHEPLNKWFIGVFDRYGQMRNAARQPM